MIYICVCVCVCVSYLCRTKKADVARVEKRTFICSPTREGAKPIPREGIKSKLGHWMDPAEMDTQLNKDFAGCMKGDSPHNTTHTLSLYPTI